MASEMDHHSGADYFGNCADCGHGHGGASMMLFYFIFVYLTWNSHGPVQYFVLSQPYASYEACEAGRGLDSIEAAFETSQCFGLPE